MLEKARQAERIAAERDAATERYERYRQAVEVATEIQALATTHPSPNPLPVVRAAVERLRALDGRIRELQGGARPARSTVQFEVAPEPTWRPLSRCLGRARRRSGSCWRGGPGRARVPGHRRPRASPSRSSAAIIAVDRAGPRRRRAVAAAQRTRCRPSCATSRSTGACAVVRRWRPSSSTAEAEDRRRSSARLGLDRPARGRGPARPRGGARRPDRPAGRPARRPRRQGAAATRWPTQRDAAALEIAQKTSALEALGPIAKEPRARERLEVEVRDQEAALERARDDEANARARVEANAVDAEQVAGQAERLAAWHEQLAAAQRRQRVFAATLAAIDRAEQATMKTATRYLETHMVRDLAAVTGGRYRRVRVDDKTLDIEVHAPEKGDWVPVSVAQPGHARPRLPRRPARARPAGDRRPAAAARVRRSVRDARRRARRARADAAQGRRDRLPGHLPDDVAALRRGGRRAWSCSRARRASTRAPTARPPPATPATRAAGRPGPANDRSARLNELGGAGSATVVLGLCLRGRVGLRRLRWRAADAAGRPVRRRPRLAGRRDGPRGWAGGRSAARRPRRRRT